MKSIKEIQKKLSKALIMIEINDEETRERVLEYLIIMKEKQLKLQKTTPSKVLYSIISLYYAAKNEIFIPKLLAHKLCVKEKEYHEEIVDSIPEEDILEVITKIIEYELTCEMKDSTLDSVDINSLIKFQRKLQTKLFKKENTNGEPTNTSEQTI